METAPTRAWHGPDWIALAGLLLASLALALGAILRRPDLTANEAYLFADPALNLVAAQHMLDGGQLYTDAAFQYGPASIYAYTGFAAVFGNSPRVYLAFLLLWSLIVVSLAYAVLRSRVRTAEAAIVTGGGLLAMILIPGALAGAQLSSTYIPMERALLLLLALLWTPPGERSVRRAAAIGALLGFWQGVRFAAPVFAGLAVVLVDLLAILVSKGSRPTFRRWLQTNLVTLGIFLVIEALWVAHAFATLPRQAALDLVWPAYILDSYLISPPGTRWVLWSGYKYFLAQLLIPLTGLAASVVVLAWAVRSRWRPRWYDATNRTFVGDLRLVVPAMFFLLGAAYYFRTVWHFQQFFWALVLPVALVLASRGWRARAAFLTLCAPGVVLIVWVMLLSPIQPGFVPLDTPRGQRLWVRAEVPARVQRIVSVATTPAPSPMNAGSQLPALFIVPMGTGVHHFFKLSLPTRQSWYIPGFGRPDDEAKMLRILDTRPAVVVVTLHAEMPGRDPCGWYHSPHFRKDFCPELGSRLGAPERIDAETWLITNAASTSARLER